MHYRSIFAFELILLHLKNIIIRHWWFERITNDKTLFDYLPINFYKFRLQMKKKKLF